MAIISSITSKGGSNKSGTAILLATYFAHAGKKVCVVDTDINQSIARWQSLRDEALPDITVVSMLDGKQLGRNINKLHNDYDLVIIDTSPGLAQKSSYTILYSDLLIIPALVSGFDLWSIEQFLERYEEVCNIGGKKIPAFLFLSMYDRRILLHQSFLKTVKELSEEYEVGVLHSKLAYRNAFKVATIQGQSALEWNDPKAKGEAEAFGKEIERILKTYDAI
ncbi:MAG: ParA family protein [Bacteroidota bacterium]